MTDLYNQLQIDIQTHNDKAYLLYEWALADTNNWKLAKNNLDLEWAINSVNYDVRRNIQFDYDDIINGAKFEMLFDNKNWRVVEEGAFKDGIMLCIKELPEHFKNKNNTLHFRMFRENDE